MSARIRLGDDDLVLTGRGVIGRAPAAEPGEAVDRLVTIDDPARSLSRSHVGYQADDGELWITDRWSQNGTVVVSATGERRLEPGRRVRVFPGDVIRLGALECAVVDVD